MLTQIPNIKEKINCAAAYLTFGIWGLIWLLISRKNAYEQKDFVLFHCYQSLFIGMLFAFLPQGLAILFSLIIQIIAIIPSSTFITDQLHVIHGLVQTFVRYGGLGLIIYCVVYSMFGKYTNLPWVSQVINRMLR